MNPSQIIGEAKAKGQSALSEAQSKQVLAAHGVPVVAETIVQTPAQAAKAARATGFPVVLKGLGAKLTHKTEMGLVRLNLGSEAQVEAAAGEMAAAAGADLEGFLVQPMLSGRREFVAGLFHDSQFGSVVMFGLGGVFTEALDDVVFRLAPISRAEAGSMLDEIGSARLLQSFRGEAPADRQALIDALVGLSDLAMAHEDVTEVDINPLLVGPDGSVAAVDALVVLGRRPAPPELRPAADMAALWTIFNPKSVAFVGASAQFGKWGNIMFTNVMASDFAGDCYLVNPKGGEIAGHKVYKDITDIPGQIEVAVVTIPAHLVRAQLAGFQQKGVRGIILVTSGFAEIGPEGRELEKAVVAEARERGMLILGPNTMGCCNPHRDFFCLGAANRPKPGTTAFVAQSGNMGVQLLEFAESQGIGIRAFAGSGNEAMLTIEDALDGFALDEITNTVLLYIESVKNGRRFFESARRVGRKKPVVVLKGGRTEAGGAAAASHTGALASNSRVFDAACRQAGVILADRPMDLLDLSAGLASLPLPKGRRVAIMTLGGGWGVVTSDLCVESGLEIPALSQDIIQTIDKILPPYWSRANPLDLVGERDPEIPKKTMEELLAWDGCDAVLNMGIVGRKALSQGLMRVARESDPNVDEASLDAISRMLDEAEVDYIRHIVELMERYEKPVMGVSLSAAGGQQTVVEVPGCKYKGIFFQTPERAVKALAEMYTYQNWLSRQE